jgi:hypothetical protein
LAVGISLQKSFFSLKSNVSQSKDFFTFFWPQASAASNGLLEERPVKKSYFVSNLALAWMVKVLDPKNVKECRNFLLNFFSLKTAFRFWM